jgi:hypothetical protein
MTRTRPPSFRGRLALTGSGLHQCLVPCGAADTDPVLRGRASAQRFEVVALHVDVSEHVSPARWTLPVGGRGAGRS